MPEIEPTVELHAGFSQPDATARPWAEVVDVLSQSEMFWLCILATGTNQLRSGLDVVVEGTAARVTDTALLQRLAAIWKSKLDWTRSVRKLDAARRGRRSASPCFGGRFEAWVEGGTHGQLFPPARRGSPRT
jgi:hypothetical protein